MKYHVAALRSTVSHRTEIDPKKVSDQAADMLLQLDFIKSADPVIYEGKRAIEKELVRIIEFVDMILLREQETTLKETDGKEEEDEDEEEDSTEEEKKPKKKVSFEESSKRSKFHNSERELLKKSLKDALVNLFKFQKEFLSLETSSNLIKWRGTREERLGKAPVAAQNEARYDERR